MNGLVLPEPIAAYFNADRQNAEAVARCFTPRAVVTDEGEKHVGLKEIRAWRTSRKSLYTYVALPVAIEQSEGQLVVRAHVTGDFPGSPADLRYHFRLERGLIASMEITV
jgi:hypothetical protein